MKFPFTYHSKQDHALVCAYLDDAYQVVDLEAWDEINQHWITIPDNTNLYAEYLTDLHTELDEFR